MRRPRLPRWWPSRNSFRWFMVGLGVLLVFFSSVSTAILQVERAGDLGTIKNQGGKILALQAQSHKLGTQNNELLKDYLAEQRQLAAAGTEQDQFAGWLVEINQALCGGVNVLQAAAGLPAVSCPALPAFAPLP